MNEEWLDPREADAFAGDVDPDNYQVITFDPGGTTGWSIFQVHPEAMQGDPDITVLDNVEWWTAGEFTGPLFRQADEMLELCNSWPAARLVTEDFKLKQLNAELSPVELNAILEHNMRPRYFVRQMPSLAMGTVPDDRQKFWGFWIPGRPHARDAVKHNITYLKRRKEQAIKAARRGNVLTP